MRYTIPGQHEVVVTPPFEGHRTFTWFTPRRRAATEYELYTVGQQSDPGQWLKVGWPIRFDDGREPYTASSTAIGCGNWPGYRDPAGLWQRPYVASANHTEQALARLIPAALSAGLGSSIDADWLDPVLSRYYAAWPFVDYGLFMALCYAVREALEASAGACRAWRSSLCCPSRGPAWPGETGLVTDAVNRRLPRLSGYDAYLCGPPAMIDAAVELVTRRGVRPRNVYFDAFVPTG